MNEKTYTFRRLGATDIFPMCSIISKVGISEFSACFEKESVRKAMMSAKDSDASDDENATIVGLSIILEIANVIISGLPKCENEIYTLLSNVTEMSVEEIQEMGMAEFFEMIMSFITKEEFKDFFKVVSKFVK